MRTFAITADNDFLVTGRSLSFVSDLDAVLNVCAHAAKAILGEMIFEQEQGMPYFETVWNGSPRTEPFEAAFRSRIAQIEGVTSIDDLTVEIVGDVMQYTATIATVYGTGQING